MFTGYFDIKNDNSTTRIQNYDSHLWTYRQKILLAKYFNSSIQQHIKVFLYHGCHYVAGIVQSMAGRRCAAKGVQWGAFSHARGGTGIIRSGVPAHTLSPKECGVAGSQEPERSHSWSRPGGVAMRKFSAQRAGLRFAGAAAAEHH